jgi:ketosteroid isomerase-like protein
VARLHVLTCASSSSDGGILRSLAASTFSDVSDFRFDVEVADVSEDLAYTVGYERFNGSIDGRPVSPMTVRVTHVYRRENGEWKIVHRHGDSVPVDESPPVEASTT